jgi:hypothetical protein
MAVMRTTVMSTTVMSTTMKLGGFVLGLGALFGAAFVVGGSVAADPAPAPAPEAEHSSIGSSEDDAPTDADLPGGLMVSQDGYTLVLQDTITAAGPQVPLRFTVQGPDGMPVTEYDVEHDKQLHLIAVRRDLSAFQHVHPVLAPDGTWSVPLDLTAPGDYRVFADFTATGGPALTLGADLAVPGAFEPRPLPAPAATATVDGYTVDLTGELTPGRSSPLTLTVSRDGMPVTDLQPYLGAFGHLVALRAGDLAYLHVHPDGVPGDGVTPAGPGVTFWATAPSTGTYRLYLDFRHAGAVHTAEFTVRADAPVPATTGAGGTQTAEPSPSATATATATTTDGHGH